MAMLRRIGLVSLVLAALAVPRSAQAGPFFGDWGWFWHEARDCPRGTYCPLHYTNPGLYEARPYFFPSNLDQYPPGPMPSPPSTIVVMPYPCRTGSPGPTSPYADPAAYFGRSPVQNPAAK